eukprot:7385322-Prymnesium_polylepis.1
MGAFSVAACKAALQKVGDDKNAAAVWLLEQGTELEAELAAEVDDDNVPAFETTTSSVDDDDDDDD